MTQNNKPAGTNAWRGLATVALMFLAAGCAENLPEAFNERKPDQATLKVFRDHTSHGPFASSLMHVHVNGTEVGTVKDGQTKEFNYQPQQGENIVKIVLDPVALYIGALSQEGRFAAEAGSLTTVKACLGWLGWDFSVGPIQNVVQDFQREITANSRMLIPDWYRQAYFIRFDETNGATYINRLLFNLLILGLILYPFFCCLYAYLGNLADAKEDERTASNIGVGLVMSVLAYLVVLVLSLFITGISYLICGFGSNKGYYIPWDFASFFLHILVLIFLLLSLAALLLPIAWRIHVPAINRKMESRAHVRLNYVAMIKAFAIMVLSALASRAAGWVAGAIILSIGTGFGIVTSSGSPPEGGQGHPSP